MNTTRSVLVRRTRTLAAELERAVLCAGALALVAACGTKDPTELPLPKDGRLTAAESEKIASSLPESEAASFRRWADRMRKGEHFGGEGVARKVRDAIIIQQAHEAREAEQLKAAKLAEQERAKQIQTRENAERQRIEAIYSLRQAVNGEIRKHIDGTISTYIPKTFYDRSNRPIGGTIEFHLKISNRAAQAAVGIAGVISITDVFGTDLGSYPFAIEPKIAPGQTVTHLVYLDFDPSNPQHQIIWRAQSLRHTWFFESAAFENGVRIDAKSMRPKPSPVPATSADSPSPTT